jgi:hypothetical protein
MIGCAHELVAFSRCSSFSVAADAPFVKVAGPALACAGRKSSATSALHSMTPATISTAWSIPSLYETPLIW